MVSLKQDALLLSLRPAGAVRLVPEAADRRTWAQVEPTLAGALGARAERALREDAPAAEASECGTARYLEAAVRRRELLKSLALGACVAGSGRYAQRMGDLIYRIAEESDWSRAPGEGGYPDFTNRRVDVDACETGALLAVVRALCRTELNALSPLIAARAEWEVQKRLIEPLIVREGELLACESEQVPRAAAALMTTVLIIETDERRRWQCIRRLVRALESHLNAQEEDAAFALGLESYLERAMALNDCFAMLGAASGGEVELRDEPVFVNMAQTFVDAYIGGGWFVNQGGRSMRPGLAPDQLFRLGESARLTKLCALASYLNRRERAPAAPFSEASAPLLQQVMAALTCAELMREPARESYVEAVYAPAVKLLAARMEGFYCAMTGAGGLSPRAHLDVGDVVLFYRGEPVLADMGEADAPHSTPVVNGEDQARVHCAAQDAALREGPGYRMLSMDIAGAYPGAARLLCWQRTLMLAPFEGGVRLMEVFDFDGAPGRAAFRFVTPHRPDVGGGVARLGPVAMSFDARLLSSVQALTSGGRGAAYLLTLSMPDDAPGGNYAFVFRPAAG